MSVVPCACPCCTERRAMYRLSSSIMKDAREGVKIWGADPTEAEGERIKKELKDSVDKMFDEVRDKIKKQEPSDDIFYAMDRAVSGGKSVSIEVKPPRLESCFKCGSRFMRISGRHWECATCLENLESVEFLSIKIERIGDRSEIKNRRKK